MNNNQSRLILVGCLMYLSTNVSADHGVGVIHDCTVSADFFTHTGEVVRGTASDLLGVEMLDWMHDSPVIAFEDSGDPDRDGPPGSEEEGIVCTVNGTTRGEIDSLGSAMVDGVPGFSYQITFEDNKEAQPRQRIQLCATLVQSPRTRHEGSAVFTTRRVATIPDELPLALIGPDRPIGQAGRGKARLRLDRVKCDYRGTGTADEGYAFERCTGPLGHDFMPGDTLMVSEVSLRLQSADRSEPVTSVEVELATDVGGDFPDSYSIIIADPGGSLYYTYSTDVRCGDIEMNLLNPD